jgi:UDP-N-acetylmuramoyl-L-alanyl-D-glutamate--2,6-diaminopimelate ligase
MLLSKLLEDIAVNNSYKDVEIKGITNNTADVKSEFIYVCISGTKNDGHLFADDAIKKGAVAIICERSIGFSNEIIVKNSSKCYSKLCFRFYDNPQEKLKLIGVTGTNGKTSTACIIKSILDFLGEKCGYIGTIGNNLGADIHKTNLTTPDASNLAKLLKEAVDNKCKYAVIEASSHALMQNRLSSCNFEISVFTNLTQDHLDYHGSMENYLKAKKKLFYNSKCAVVNMDDEKYSDIIKDTNCKVSTFSIKNRNADYVAFNIISNLSGVRYALMARTNLVNISYCTPGETSVYNTMSAIAVCKELGYPLEKIAKAITNAKSIKGRLEILKTNRDFGIIIDYAHTPDGMYRVLKTVKSFTKNNLIVLFGCGGDRDKTKRAKMGEIASSFADKLIVTSDNPRTESPKDIICDIIKGIKGDYIMIENRRDAIKRAIDEAEKDDIIILLGKGHETYQIIGNEKINFDEREIVENYLKQSERNYE